MRWVSSSRHVTSFGVGVVLGGFGKEVIFAYEG